MFNVLYRVAIDVVVTLLVLENFRLLSITIALVFFIFNV